MALSIKTEEADRLAREVARTHGVTLTEAVTLALREQCARDRERVSKRTPEEKAAAVRAIVAEMQPHLDRRPMTKADWDEAAGDTD
ncbi:MAG TPA: type II toxin-antitoxin system VapB family antitoxin [Caulobacteraceae bacterium]|jgi:antitoxin VapB